MGHILWHEGMNVGDSWSAAEVGRSSWTSLAQREGGSWSKVIAIPISPHLHSIYRKAYFPEDRESEIAILT